MTGDEADRLYEKLAVSLRSAGFGWVVLQVEGAIAIGNVVTVAATYAPDEEDVAVYSMEAVAARSLPSDIKAEPVSAVERFGVLIEAARQAIVVPELIKAALPGLFGPRATEIRFRGDGDQTGPVVALHMSEMPSAVAGIQSALAGLHVGLLQ